jgi:tetratricopeptide (TPR) repeat protein
MVDESIAAMKLAVAAGYPGMEQTEWARLTLGHLYERYGMLDSAQLQYAIALTERPNYPFAIAALSEIYSAKGQLVLADSLNDVAMSLIPEVSFFISRASREMKRGKLAKGQAMTREILEMFADDEKAGHQMSLEMARVQMNLLNSPEQALNYAMKEYNIRPENIDVNRVLAEIYFTKGDLIKAKEHLDKALATGSKDPATLCLDGMLQLKTGQEADGTKLLKSVFVEIPYLECSYCADARKIIL